MEPRILSHEKLRVTPFSYRGGRLLVAVDCIVFGFDGSGLKALLVERGFDPGKGKWSLMGGFVGERESIDDAARRVLKELTGLEDIFLEQLRCFGEPGRDPGGRVVAVAYYALIRLDEPDSARFAGHHAKWFRLDRLPPLAFDHKDMLRLALGTLREKAIVHPLGFELLPDKFTLQQLQALYEAIYATAFDKRNFTRKMLGLDILRKLDEKEKSSSRKGAFYYVFNRAAYRELEKQGTKFL